MTGVSSLPFLDNAAAMPHFTDADFDTLDALNDDANNQYLATLPHMTQVSGQYTTSAQTYDPLYTIDNHYSQPVPFLGSAQVSNAVQQPVFTSALGLENVISYGYPDSTLMEPVSTTSTVGEYTTVSSPSTNGRLASISPPQPSASSLFSSFQLPSPSKISGMNLPPIQKVPSSASKQIGNQAAVASDSAIASASARFKSPTFFNQSNGQFVAPLLSSYPSLIANPAISMPYSNYTFNAPPTTMMTSPSQAFHQPPSPALSIHSVHSPSYRDSFKARRSQSPKYNANYQYHLYAQQFSQARRSSYHSINSPQAFPSPSGSNTGEDDPATCPHEDCRKRFKDLKAHLLTHLNERPEKCPITSCEYHVKGFARKYDKNRHTLTHYKGTMVCGFCPAAGSPSEKSFNRADVFKRHLTSVHNVEATPPNSRKRTPNTRKGLVGNENKTGLCSTCGVTFSSVQDFYEHLDECVLRVVQQADPQEASNQKNLGTIENDDDVQKTLERHNLPLLMEDAPITDYDDLEDDNDSDNTMGGDSTAHSSPSTSRDSRSGKGSIKSRRDCEPGNPA